MSGIAIDPLIAEAKERARRRRLYLFAVLAVAVAGALTYELLPSGGAGARGSVSGAPATRSLGVGEFGSSGGVTWVMNRRGLWLTANGGDAWRKVALPRGTGRIEQDASDVQFADPQHGWISIWELTGSQTHGVGRWMFARTTDGGRTWQPSYPSGCDERCGAAGMSFLDARHGYLLVGAPSAGIPNQLLRTADGGRTWQPVAKMPLLGRITFLSDRVGFLFAYGGAGGLGYFGPPIGTLYRTIDSGRTWAPYSIGGSKSLVEEPIRVAGNRIVVVQNGPACDRCVNFAPKTIYSSADGRTWRGGAVPAGVARARPLKFAFTAGSSNAWAFISGSDVYTTRDAGRHWRKIAIHLRVTRSPQRLWGEKIHFTSSRVGWALLHRRLYRTTDGGVHWKVAGPLGKPIPIHACNPAQLTATLWSSTSQLRHARAVLSIRNVAGFRCRLSGWPTVEAVEADGSSLVAKQISPAYWKRPGRPVVLGAGGGVRAILGDTGVRPANGWASCPKAVSLRVTPPGGHNATTLAGPWARGSGRTFYLPLCNGISVTPVF